MVVDAVVDAGVTEESRSTDGSRKGVTVAVDEGTGGVAGDGAMMAEVGVAVGVGIGSA